MTRQTKEILRTVRFTPEEDKALSEKVKAFGGTISDFLRKSVFNSEIVSLPSPETIKLLQQYQRVLTNLGTNLNAIARRANNEKLTFTVNELSLAITECNALLQTIKAIKNKSLR